MQKDSGVADAVVVVADVVVVVVSDGWTTRRDCVVDGGADSSLLRSRMSNLDDVLDRALPDDVG